MKRCASNLVLVVLAAVAAGAPPARAAVSADITHLPLRRAVLLEPVASPVDAIIAEDSLLAAACRPDFADLRLMNAEGESVPLDPLRVTRSVAVERMLHEFSFEWRREGEGEWVADFDLGEDPPAVLVAELAGPIASSPPRFTASGDGSNWVLLAMAEVKVKPGLSMVPPDIVERAAPGTRFHVEGFRRHLRLVREPGAPDPSPEDRLRLVERTETPMPHESVPFAEHDRGFATGDATRWQVTLELAGPSRILTAVELRSLRPGTRDYSITVEARLPGAGWRHVGANPESAWVGGVTSTLSIEPIDTGALRITVHGADAPNDPFEVAAVRATPARWRFRAMPGVRYWVAFGDPFATRPAGAERFIEPSTLYSDGARPLIASLASAEPNPFHREPGFGLEWLKRRPAALTAMMLAILALIAWLTLRRARVRA